MLILNNRLSKDENNSDPCFDSTEYRSVTLKTGFGKCSVRVIIGGVSVVKEKPVIS